MRIIIHVLCEKSSAEQKRKRSVCKYKHHRIKTYYYTHIKKRVKNPAFCCVLLFPSSSSSHFIILGKRVRYIKACCSLEKTKKKKKRKKKWGGRQLNDFADDDVGDDAKTVVLLREEIFGTIIARVGLRVWRLARNGFFWSDDDAGETSTLVGKCDEEEEKTSGGLRRLARWIRTEE